MTSSISTDIEHVKNTEIQEKNKTLIEVDVIYLFTKLKECHIKK